MDRREFLGKLKSGAVATGAAAAGIGAATYARSRTTVIDGTERLAGEVKALTKRVDDIDERHKRLFRMMIVVASVSTGLDALTLLKGDPFS